MATRKIVEIGDDKLRKQCKPVEKFDLRLKMLLKDMAETMYKNDGAGLAAPQVGILKRVCVVDASDHLYELVNPEIVSREGEQEGPEGCLSVPGRAGVVKRPMKVVVHAQNAKGEPFEVVGEGFLARALCHEIDHLNGVLYVDIMEHEIFQEDDEGEDDGAEEADASAEPQEEASL
ncbi:MAG: peptide deformylase [Candidatus Limiplasma sp.]|nr:peptide deformylase [Candidatus Limiplasma sp.]MEA5144549.1 peptide deformylase [Candidatus Limiplasma sp.]